MRFFESVGREQGRSLIHALNAHGEGALPPEKKLEMLEAFRASHAGGQRETDMLLIENTEKLSAALTQTQQTIAKYQGLLERLARPPWRVGVYFGPVETPEGVCALVDYQGMRLVVAFGEHVTPPELALGDEVYLNHELSAVMGRCEAEVFRVGETGRFERRLPDGRLVVVCRDEHLVVNAAASLDPKTLRPGDLVRFDRRLWLACERLEREAGRRFLLEEVPEVGVDQVGGQRGALRRLLSALSLRLTHRKLAQEFRLRGRLAILLEGPPGCGKTLMARVATSEIRRRSGRRGKFAVVKPAEWEDPYVGVTQQNIRNCFQMLREAAADGFAVLFLDEIEAVGRHRGSAVGHHSDKFLAALLAEIDGFVDRNDVAIIAATNRKDLVDAALLSRFDVEISVPRPDMQGAREIFNIHLPEGIPFSPNGSRAGHTREQIIERAVARLYSPNGENEVCELRFRDSSRRRVRAAELMSGRAIEQICSEAREAAALRAMETGQVGVCAEDLEESISEMMDRFATTLTRYNAHSYLADLPQDMDVVAVEPLRRRTRRAHRYLRSQ